MPMRHFDKQFDSGWWWGFLCGSAVAWLSSDFTVAVLRLIFG